LSLTASFAHAAPEARLRSRGCGARLTVKSRSDAPARASQSYGALVSVGRAWDVKDRGNSILVHPRVNSEEASSYENAHGVGRQIIIAHDQWVGVALANVQRQRQQRQRLGAVWRIGPKAQLHPTKPSHSRWREVRKNGVAAAPVSNVR
jgi:hypothetical protein